MEVPDAVGGGRPTEFLRLVNGQVPNLRRDVAANLAAIG
jgi:hypothetical protein